MNARQAKKDAEVLANRRRAALHSMRESRRTMKYAQQSYATALAVALESGATPDTYREEAL